MKINLTLDSFVKFDFDLFKNGDGEGARKIKNLFSNSNPDFFNNQRMGFSNHKTPEIIKSFGIYDGKIYISRGCYGRLGAFLKKRGHQIKVKDARLVSRPQNFKSNIILRAEQKKPVEVILKHQQGIMRGPCSAGKTVMLLEAIARANQITCVIVWNTIHQKQWIEEAIKFLGIPKNEIGGVGGVFKKRKIGALNICMQQSLYNKEYLEAFNSIAGFVAVDECQRCAAKTYLEVINYFPAKYRIGVSANERRSDKKEFLIYDSLGKIIHEIPDDKIGSRKSAKINLIRTKFQNDDFEMTRNNVKLLNDMAVDENRNQIIINRVLKRVRNKKLCLIFCERKVQAIILFFHLKKICRADLLVGKDSKKYILEQDWKPEWKDFMLSYNADEAFVRVKELGELKKLDVIVATQKGDVGLNIKTIDYGIITTPTGGNIERFNQQKGRIERNYDSELEENFGPKETPVLEYIWDSRIGSLYRKGDNIRNSFNNVKIFKG